MAWARPHRDNDPNITYVGKDAGCLIDKGLYVDE